jgi:DNA replication and repair protein RecF
MRLTTLRISNARNIVEMEIPLAAGFTAFVGPNGAGKTSVLEAAYLLSHAQSFRPGPNDVLVRDGADRMVLFGRAERSAGAVQLGLAREFGGWLAKVNHEPVSNLSELLREFALVCLEPGSHALISGPGALRRRFLDWGVFHLEPEHFGRTRQYQRLLRQRNTLLKQGRDLKQLDAWDNGLAEAGEALAEARAQHFRSYARTLSDVLAVFLPELGTPAISLGRGWSEQTSLIQALAETRVRDMSKGHTTRGPHRADWCISFANAPTREHLSRGQEKLCALACVLAQAQQYCEQRGEWPVVALDDLASELDEQHQKTVVSLLARAGAQVLVSGTELPVSLHNTDSDLSVFHVEHGNLR